MSAATAPHRPSRCPEDLVTAVRRAVGQRGDWGRTADRVAAALRGHLPGPGILTAAERQGDPAGYRQHLLHAEPDGSFSVVGLVWRPGQVTPVHDHVTWCVTGVLQGAEYEELFAVTAGGVALEQVAAAENGPGEVTGFAPPGDIHRVRNRGAGPAVSVHIYGADIARLGTSVRRVYDLPARRPATLSTR